MRNKPINPKQSGRPAPDKEATDTILVLCSGKCTEQIYFNFLRREWRTTSVTVRNTGSNNAPLNIVDRAVRVRDEFDRVWCVMDVEIEPDPNLDEALAKAKKYEINVALSTPQFEFWYILHFEFTTQLFNTSDQVLERLKRSYQKYDKTMEDICNAVLNDYETAITNAERVIRHHSEAASDTMKANPSTHVHKVVKLMSSLKRS